MIDKQIKTNTHFINYEFYLHILSNFKIYVDGEKVSLKIGEYNKFKKGYPIDFPVGDYTLMITTEPNKEIILSFEEK